MGKFELGGKIQTFSKLLRQAEILIKEKDRDFEQYSSLSEIQKKAHYFFISLHRSLTPLEPIFEEEVFHSFISQEVVKVKSSSLQNFENLLEDLYNSFKPLSESYLEISQSPDFANTSISIKEWFDTFGAECYVSLLKLIGLVSEKKTILASFLKKGDFESAEAMLQI